jgi:hypothetical protein
MLCFAFFTEPSPFIRVPSPKSAVFNFRLHEIHGTHRWLSPRMHGRKKTTLSADQAAAIVKKSDTLRKLSALAIKNVRSLVMSVIAAVNRWAARDLSF